MNTVKCSKCGGDAELKTFRPKHRTEQRKLGLPPDNARQTLEFVVECPNCGRHSQAERQAAG